MRGQPKRFIFSKLPEKNGGNFILYVLVRFIPEMFSALSAAYLCSRAFVCFAARLAVHNFAVYSVLGS